MWGLLLSRAAARLQSREVPFSLRHRCPAGAAPESRAQAYLEFTRRELLGKESPVPEHRATCPTSPRCGQSQCRQSRLRQRTSPAAGLRAGCRDEAAADGITAECRDNGWPRMSEQPGTTGPTASREPALAGISLIYAPGRSRSLPQRQHLSQNGEHVVLAVHWPKIAAMIP